MDVFVVQHVHECAAGIEDVKFIGVFSTETLAREAVTRLSVQPGFLDTQDGFNVERYTLDEDHWREGFITVDDAVRSVGDEEA